MGDDKKKKKNPDGKGGGKSFAITTVLAVVAGVLLILAFFLPVVTIKPAYRETFEQWKAKVDRWYERAEEDMQKWEHEKAVVKLGDIDGLNQFLMPSARETRVPVKDVRGAHAVLTSFGKVVNHATLLNLFELASVAQQHAALADQMRVGEINLGIMAGTVQTVKAGVLAVPLVGVFVVAVVVLRKFRPLPTALLLLVFVAGAAFAGAAGILEAWTLVDQAVEADKVESDPIAANWPAELRQTPMTAGIGTRLIFLGGLILVVATVFGVSKSNRAACYGMYVVILVILIVAALFAYNDLKNQTLERKPAVSLASLPAPLPPIAICGEVEFR